MSDRIIDAHHHLWQFGRFHYGWIAEGRGPLGRDYLPADLAAAAAPPGVRATVLVQTIASFDETRWFCELADASDLIQRVVGWVDLGGQNVGDELDELMAASPSFAGVRVAGPALVDGGGAPRLSALSGLGALQARGLTCDLLIGPDHLAHVPALAEAAPGLRIVIDHLAKPPIRRGGLSGWAEDLAAAGRWPNVHAKVSGLITEADRQAWTPADLQPYIDHAIDCFGFERLMYGSDWPVCLQAGSYEQALDAVRTCIGDATTADQAKLLAQTAADFYRVES